MPVVRTCWCLGILVFLPLVLFAQAPSHVSSTDLVLARVRLGGDTAAVRRVLGAPDSVAHDSDPSESGEWTAWWYRDLDVLFFNDGKIVGVWIRGASRGTRRGLRIGATRSEVIRLYGAPSPSTADTTLVYLSAHREGAPGLFVYLSRGRVSAIYAGVITD
jgi:hypothetical protein